MNDAGLITNDRDGGCFVVGFFSVLLLQLRMMVNMHLSGPFHPLNAVVLFLPFFLWSVRWYLKDQILFFSNYKMNTGGYTFFCVHMMHSLIPSTYLNLIFPFCFMYKLQFVLEAIYLCFCTFQPAKIAGKFYRRATAWHRKQPLGIAASHCLINNPIFHTFSNTMYCRDRVYLPQVNIWCLKTSRTFSPALTSPISHSQSMCRWS